MSNELLNLFPLTIFKSKVSLESSLKRQMIDEIYKMEKKSTPESEKNQGRSWTGDTQGFEFLHKDKKFEKFFIEVKKKLFEYIEILRIDQNQIDIYIQRSWATLSRGVEHISMHKHMQSHLSFAYYLKKEKTDANIVFVSENHQNEFLPALFISPGVQKKKIITGRNIYNSPFAICEANEDEILIFPSKTPHQTQKNIKNNERISISADIFITAKNSKNLEHFVTPYSDWKKI